MSDPQLPASSEATITVTGEELEATWTQLTDRLDPELLRGELVRHVYELKESFKRELEKDLAAANESFRTRLRATIDSLEAEIRKTRRRLVAELETGLSETSVVLHRATVGPAQTMLRDASTMAGATGRLLVGTVRENPVPAALVGLGVLWLLLRARQAR